MEWPLPVDLDDGALERLLFPPAATAEAARARPRPGWVAVDKDMRRKGVTLALLWEEYRAAHPDGFGYSWFSEHYDAFKSRLQPTMRQSHRCWTAGFDLDVGSHTTVSPAEASDAQFWATYVRILHFRGCVGHALNTCYLVADHESRGDISATPGICHILRKFRGHAQEIFNVQGEDSCQ
jgi:hypothetical protein